jgi:putative hydrolase of the HAD superfamily
MSQATPALVIFDMNDVLCRYDLNERLKVLSRHSGRTARNIKSAIWDSGFEDESDCGRFADPHAYLEEFCRRLGRKITAAQWIEACRASIIPDQKVLDLARHMQKRSRGVLFSNNGPLMKTSLAEVFPEAYEIFVDEFYCSCEFSACKPDPAAYSRLVERLRFAPEQCYYIDDKPSNVEGALKADCAAITSRPARPWRVKPAHWALPISQLMNTANAQSEARPTIAASLSSAEKVNI